MKEYYFLNIKSRIENFKYSSMEYIDYEDMKDYEVVADNDDIILLCGYNREAGITEYHWAADSIAVLGEYLMDKDDFFITFIPEGWVCDLKKIGLSVRNAWHDYFMYNLDDIDYDEDEFEFLTIDKCDEASRITMECRNQTRGFTGQTAKWIKAWISNEGDDMVTRNNAILVEKNIRDEIVGIVCTATYAHESDKGPIVWIREVAVKPSFQNKGIGRRLIIKALSYGKKYNATRAFLSADENNYAGIHLYTSIGFIPSDDKSQIDMIKKRK